MASKLNLKQTPPSVGLLVTGMVGTRKYESRKITFGVQTLFGNVKNIQAYIIDSILERIPCVTNNKRNKLVEVIRNSIKRSPGWMIMETEIGVVEGGKRKVTQDSDTGKRNDESYKFQTIANITKKESQIHMDQIEQTWKLEAIGIGDLMTDSQDEKALEAFQKSLTTDKEGRCVVSWPWKNQEIAPRKGYGLVWGRLRTTIRRLKKSPELLECYDEQGRYLVIADVEKAFLQVSLKQEDRDVTRFLWLKDKGSDLRKPSYLPIHTSSLSVVSSLFLLTAVIRHLLNEGSSKLSAEVAKNLYVDNVVLTAESELESNRKAHEAKELFKPRCTWKIPEGLQIKRQILQFYAPIYDPLGLLCPIILPWKLLVQDLWKKSVSWDEKLEPEETRHTSQRAVGLVVYARRNNIILSKPQLIHGKTRLVPKRESRNQSANIPRLELLTVTIGVRVLEFIKREIEVEKTYLWTDSACVLHWLRKPPVGSRYVSNRIDGIRRNKEIEFRHIRPASNPADQASRGLLPGKLKDNSLWWNGPSWLWEPKEKWLEDKVMEGNITSVCMAMGLMEEAMQSDQVTALMNESRFSSLSKLIRTMLYVLRFLAMSKEKKEIRKRRFSRENFASNEYDKVIELIIKMTQLNIMQKEIEHWVLRKDQNRIWSCVGRLRKAMPRIEDFSYFISRRKIAELIVKHYHEKLFHAGMHYTWSKMRQRNETFETVGLNLFGPVLIKEDHANAKRWVTLFTCLATRAVHLEVVETMSTEQFVQAFRIFISRRKQKNLIAASKVLVELSTAENETAEWEFITPGAPWQGGVYERMVGVVKRSLRKAIGTKLLNNRGLITLVIELETIINKRPLMDLEEIGLVLKPGDFLNPGSARGENLTEERTRRYAGKKIYKRRN
uniref:Reverse transcriptase domain-containing protein n=1 Tax=Loa loa TaxID=7209 RepID=A0A1I7VES3_LOALO